MESVAILLSQPKVKIYRTKKKSWNPLQYFCEPPEGKRLDEAGATPKTQTFCEPPEGRNLDEEGAGPKMHTFCGSATRG